MHRIITTVIALVFVAVEAAGVCEAVYQLTHHCVRSHLEDVEGQYRLTTGGDLVLIPAHVERVCDVWEKNK